MIHITINVSENHVLKYGWVIRKEWICNGVLKWWHYVYHTYKIKYVDFKICDNSVKVKIQT